MNDPLYKRDIEESDEVLDSEESTVETFWEKKQRELVTSVVDYNLATLSDLIQTNAIDLSPEYQRRFRWDSVRQSKLIESFLMNVPVPPIFLNEDVYGKYSVIDGKQRLNTIFEFLRGRLQLTGLKIFTDINGLNFDSLPQRLKTVIKTRPTLRAVIILRQSDEDVKFEVFQRLNTGGVHLNPQEIRNSAYTGSLNNLILELSINKQFHKLLGIKKKEQSSIYQEMRDAEFVLRYFTFRESWADFSGGMKRQLDTFMANNRYATPEYIRELKDDFLENINTVELCFGEHAFQRWLPEKKQWKKLVLAALYDAQMFACRGIALNQIESKQQKILTATKRLFSNHEFRKAIDSATNSPTSFKERINIMRNTIMEIIRG